MSIGGGDPCRGTPDCPCWLCSPTYEHSRCRAPLLSGDRCKNIVADWALAEGETFCARHRADPEIVARGEAEVQRQEREVADKLARRRARLDPGPLEAVP